MASNRDTTIEGAIWLLDNTNNIGVIQKTFNTIEEHKDYILSNARLNGQLYSVLVKLTYKYDRNELILDEEEESHIVIVQKPRPRCRNSVFMYLVTFYCAVLLFAFLYSFVST